MLKKLWINENELKAIKLGPRSVRIRLCDINNVMEEHSIKDDKKCNTQGVERTEAKIQEDGRTIKKTPMI